MLVRGGVVMHGSVDRVAGGGEVVDHRAVVHVRV